MTISKGIGRGGAREGAGRPKDIHTSFSRDAQDRLRARIQTAKLIQTLSDIALQKIKSNPVAVQACTVLLKKVMPDLTATEHSGEISVNKVIRAPEVAATTDQWLEDNVPEEHQHATH